MEVVKFPRRPGQGTKGRPTQLAVNMFPVKGNLNGTIYLYDVTIAKTGSPSEVTKPGEPLKKNPFSLAYNRQIVAKLAEESKDQLKGIRLAYDGKSLIYTTRKLPFPEKEFLVRHLDPKESTEWELQVILKLVKTMPISSLISYISGTSGEATAPMEIIAALDVFAVSNAAHKFYTRGHSFFSSQNPGDLGGGVAAWSGFYSSVRALKCGLVLNVDVSNGSFMKPQPVIDLAVELWRLRSPDDLLRKNVSDHECKILERYLRGNKVSITHQGNYERRLTVNAISLKNANQITFDAGETGETTVSEYFRRRYNITLRFPNLPCIQVGTKNSFLPLELCRVADGQYYRRKLNEDQTSRMIKIANQKPEVRARETQNKFTSAQFENNPFLSDLGVQQSKEMLRIEGRTLNPPALLYGNSRTVQPNSGAWNLRDLKFVAAAPFPEWAVLVVASERDAPRRKVEEFVYRLVDMAGTCGMSVEGERRRPHIEYADERNVSQAVQRLYERKNFQMLLCMVRGSAETYSQIKKMSDQKLGFVSQCMLIKHVYKISPQYLGNILLKINSKLSGRNLHLKENLPKMDVPTMIIGCDVTHPTGGGRNDQKPSVVALVASLDRYLSKYTALMNMQPSNSEDIRQMKNYILELLRRFKQFVRQLPKRIIFFRDGVSEGQFETVFRTEVNALQQAFKEFEPDYEPALTFIIVQKRHHVRLFPDGRDRDRSGNVMPGTVVDDAIVHPTEFDFYLMSHSGIQGTSRPVKYHVLYDQNGFSADELQEFIYRLCHTNARCTRSTSLPPCIQYAHLVAYRGRVRFILN